MRASGQRDSATSNCVRVSLRLTRFPSRKNQIPAPSTSKVSGKLAQTLHVDQSAISKLEHRTDMYVSTLRRCIAAMGGQLEIRAVFPEGTVRISQFERLAAED